MDLDSGTICELESDRRAARPQSGLAGVHFEKALVAGVRVPRRVELMNGWQMSLPDLLNFAIELGHALWNEKDEAKANRVAQASRIEAIHLRLPGMPSKALPREGRKCLA